MRDLRGKKEEGRRGKKDGEDERMKEEGKDMGGGG
jgi:hypothetical protein